MTEGASAYPDGFSRHFVRVGGREVHYLLAGSGPVAMLLPGFPWSAGSLAPLARTLADDFTVVIVDLPGCGNSHGLEGSPVVADYADAVAETLDALGVDRCHLYGLHSAAQVALEVGNRHPSRVANLVLEGIPLLDDAQLDDLAGNFCPRFTPSWDGAHIAATWWWCREQSIFSPWYRPSAATRLDVDEQPPDVLQRRATDVLRAGPEYGAGLRAAFAHRAADALAGMAVPTTLAVGTGDPFETHPTPPPQDPDNTDRPTGNRGSFAEHPGRLGGPGVQEIQLPPTPDRERRLGALIGGGSGADRSLRHPTQVPTPGAVNRAYVTTRNGQLLLRRIPGAGRPLVMLHASPTSSVLLEPLMKALAPGRAVIAFDTPGNGESDPPLGLGPFQIADFAAIVNEALAGLEVGDFDLYGTHTGALIAVEVALANPGVRRLILEGVTMFDDGGRPDLLARPELLANYLPLFEPTWDGTHLQAAWHFRRSFTTYWPWFRHSRAGIRWVPMVELSAFHRGFVETAKRLDTYHLPYRAALGYPTQERLRKVRVPTIIAAHPDDPLQAHSPEAAELVPGGRWDALPDDVAGVAALYEAFLSGP